MANGDLAAQAGLAVFAGGQDRRQGYDNDNIRGDELAAHMLTGGHPWSRITDKPATYPTTWAQVEGRPTLDTGSTPHTAAVRDADAGLAAARFWSSREPDQPNHATTKRYVDNHLDLVWDAIDQLRGQSSRRYKDQITPADLDPATVLALEPVRFHYKTEPTGALELGLIAEDVADAGATDLVIERDGKVDGVRYDRLAVALLAAVKDLAARVAELEGNA